MNEELGHLIEQKTDEEKKEIALKELEKPSKRPMDMIDMDAIRSVLRGEKPSFSVSMYKSENLTANEDKDKDSRHKVLQELRQELNPTFCPECGNFMEGKNEKLNKKFYKLRGRCFDCVIAFEHQLKIDNKWHTYEAQIITGNKLGFLKDIKQQADDFLNTGLKKVNEFVDSDGKIEKWANTDYEFTKKFVEGVLDEINGYIDDLTEYFKELTEELENGTTVA